MVLAVDPVFADREPDEPLATALTDGGDDAAASPDAVDDRVRDGLGRRAGEVGGVERRFVGERFAAVGGRDGHVVAETIESFAGVSGQFRDALGREDVPRTDDLGDDGGVVAAAGPHLEDAVAALDVEQVGHQYDHVRRADRLVVADRERPVGVRRRALRLRDELVARDRADRRQRPLARVEVVAERAHQFAPGGRGVGVVHAGS